MTIPPETLKSIAEAMGYEYEGTHENGNVWCSKKGIVSKFHPETNPTQREEMQLWLEDKGWVLERYEDKYNIISDDCVFVADSHYERLCMAMNKELGIGDL